MVEKWSRWSDREIARRCAVGPHLVSELRETLTVRTHSEIPAAAPARTYTDKHGTTTAMHTENIGRRPVPSRNVVAAASREGEEKEASREPDPAPGAPEPHGRTPPEGYAKMVYCPCEIIPYPIGKYS